MPTATPICTGIAYNFSHTAIIMEHRSSCLPQWKPDTWDRCAGHLEDGELLSQSPSCHLWSRQQFFFFFFKILFVCLFVCSEMGKGGRNRGGETDQLPLTSPPVRTWPTTQACALTRNQTGEFSVHRPALNPLSHTSQGKPAILIGLGGNWRGETSPGECRPAVLVTEGSGSRQSSSGHETAFLLLPIWMAMVSVLELAIWFLVGWNPEPGPWGQAAPYIHTRTITAEL